MTRYFGALALLAAAAASAIVAQSTGHASLVQYGVGTAAVCVGFVLLAGAFRTACATHASVPTMLRGSRVMRVGYGAFNVGLGLLLLGLLGGLIAVAMVLVLGHLLVHCPHRLVVPR